MTFNIYCPKFAENDLYRRDPVCGRGARDWGDVKSVLNGAEIEGFMLLPDRLEAEPWLPSLRIEVASPADDTAPGRRWVVTAVRGRTPAEAATGADPETGTLRADPAAVGWEEAYREGCVVHFRRDLLAEEADAAAAFDRVAAAAGTNTPDRRTGVADLLGGRPFVVEPTIFVWHPDHIDPNDKYGGI